MNGDRKIEFGDFQTPNEMAQLVVDQVAARGICPRSIIEPTCGTGNFVVAAMEGFRTVVRVFGLDINPDHVRECRNRVVGIKPHADVSLATEDFFAHDWARTLTEMPEPILVIGNPPWVTSAGVSSHGGTNLPTKSNFQGHRGLNAKTGRSNFDIAEWMIIQLMNALRSRQGTIAVLLKTTVARKVLHHVWRAKLPMSSSAIYLVDGAKYFGISAAACLLVCDFSEAKRANICDLFASDDWNRRERRISWRGGQLIADDEARRATRHLDWSANGEPEFRWRSGIKHDCAMVMEFRETRHGLQNGLGEVPKLEPDFLFPLLKGSDVAGGRTPTRWMLVPQRRTCEDTARLRESSPRTWAYLMRHADRLDRRGSSIYRNRPRFSIFGVGDYSFASWKVAICGLYKKLDFCVVGPHAGRAVVLDDTSYHLSFDSEEEARRAAELLASEKARNYFGALIFWDAKRPVTAETLNRLDLRALAEEVGVSPLPARRRAKSLLKSST